MPPEVREPPFRPELFAHGRLLYRFPGSDSCRFSPKLAYSLVRHVSVDLPEQPSVLWDPFCGAGLIVSIACLFFPTAFSTIVASDTAPEAVGCCEKNLLLLSNSQAAAKRLKQMRGLQNRNARSHSRWGEVAAHLDELMPTIQQNERLAPPVSTFVASAFQLPPQIRGNVHFVGDLPYGKTSHMDGDCRIESLVDTIAVAYPTSTMTFVMTRDIAQDIVRETKRAIVETRPCKNGRTVIHAKPSFS